MAGLLEFWDIWKNGLDRDEIDVGKKLELLADKEGSTVNVRVEEIPD